MEIKSAMEDKIIEQFISKKRLEQYDNDIEKYKENLYISEKYYILISIFEISLRNSINFHFGKKYSNEWLFNLDKLPKLPNPKKPEHSIENKVETAKKVLSKRKEEATHNKVVAELSFGFWTSLFHKSYSNIMRIPDIKDIFPNLPSKQEKKIDRQTMYQMINPIRILRNRIFHHEKIIDRKEYDITKIESEIFDLLYYFDEEIYNFAKELTSNNK